MMRSIRKCLAITGSLALALILMMACKRTEHTIPQTSSKPSSPAGLTGTLLDLALHEDNPGEALARLCHAFTLDASSPDLWEKSATILEQTHWNIPLARIRHPLPIDRIHCSDRNQLWVGLHRRGGSSASLTTLARWNLDTGKIESVMFPAETSGNRSLIMDPSRRRIVMERSGTVLLCDAASLKPIRAIDPLPDDVNPASCVVFSPDGVIMAQPTPAPSSTRRIHWQIRDSNSGDIIREDRTDTNALALAAYLDTRHLRVLHSDGSLLEIPVSPVETSTWSPDGKPLHLTHALFSPAGTSAFVQELRPAAAFRRRWLHFGNHTTTMPMDAESLLHVFPWNRYPGIWPGLMEYPSSLWHGTHQVAISRNHARVHTASDITTMSVCDKRIITGESAGFLTIHRILPRPLSASHDHDSTTTSPAMTHHSLQALQNITVALTGLSYRPEFRDCHRHSLEERLSAFRACDFSAVALLFPHLDFSPLQKEFDALRQSPHPPDALSLLNQRLARYSEKPSYPEIENAFAHADEAKIRQAIENSAPSGARAAQCLSLALSSTQPSWIAMCLRHFPSMPPTLARMARTRIAWLENRKADAIGAWPEACPDYERIRQTENWDGWESADFQIAYEQIQQSISGELAGFLLPDQATSEQRNTLFSRLTEEAALRTLGRSRYARACLDAALDFASSPDETARTFELARIARSMGAPAAPCLRAEAGALTSMGDHRRARDRWVDLITNHPLGEQQSDDYAQAAYSAFESQDSQQAMAILATGAHRFPQDASYALRAGWIALLTAHPESAWRFLSHGVRAGYPQEQQPHALALLAISAFQSGAPEEASAYHAELGRIAKQWLDAEYIESLRWPAELTSVLHHLAENSGLRPNH